jgi:hypothetical protein
VIIGRVINKGLYTDSATQFPSDFAQTAPSTSFYWTEYYWIHVPPQEAGTGQKDGFASLEILALRFDQSSGHVSSLDVFSPVQIQKPGKFFVCDDTHPQPTQAVADFQPCPHRGNDLAHTMWQPTDATLEAGAWFSCLDGCCSAQVPPFFEFRSAKAVQRDAAA